MNEIIRKTIKSLKVELIVTWVIAIVFFLLSQYMLRHPLLGTEGMYAMPGSTHEYVCYTAGIFITLLGLPLAFKLFTLNTTHNIRRMNKDEIVGNYHKWSRIRLGILLFTFTACLVVHHLTWHPSALVCAGLSFMMTLMCWPSESQLRHRVENHDTEEEE